MAAVWHASHMTTSILFVCLGNYCRSPMAEALFRHHAREERVLDRFRIDSAGTGDWHLGKPPHRETIAQLELHGIDATGMLARQITVDDLRSFDHVIAMDLANVRDLRSLGGSPADATISLLLEELPDTEITEVPDPYYVGSYDVTYELVDAGCRALLARLIHEHPLPRT